MKIGHDETQMFELFAGACDQLNDYASSLSQSVRFFEVHTKADIRNYESGWRLEKWIEAHINEESAEEGGYFACWWLELGPANPSGLKLNASFTINPEHADITLLERTAVTLPELKEAIAASVHELQTALETNHEVIQAVAAAQAGVEYLTPYMKLPQGIRITSSAEAERQAAEAKAKGAVVYLLRGDEVVNRSSFFDLVGATLPLDPPPVGNHDWQALSDSLWRGISALDTDRILIIWSNSYRLKESPEDLEKALSMLRQLTETIATKELTILLT